MRYANIIYNDIVNAPGMSITFYTQGCSHKCKGCFNQDTWDFKGGKFLTQEKIKETFNIVELYKDSYDNLVLLGGDPLQNPTTTLSIIKQFKNKFPDKKIWCYTGYTWNEIVDIKNPLIKTILKNIDVLIDGKFVEELKDLTLKYRGSSNQRIIDVKESLLNKSIIELKF